MFQEIKHRLSQSNRCHECFSCVQGDAGRGEFCLQEAAESELGRKAGRQAGNKADDEGAGHCELSPL
jgi:hypothetical protein